MTANVTYKPLTTRISLLIPTKMDWNTFKATKVKNDLKPTLA